MNHAFTREEEDEEEMPQARYHDGSDVVMAVRVMARLCDGQNKACQVRMYTLCTVWLLGHTS